MPGWVPLLFLAAGGVFLVVAIFHDDRRKRGVASLVACGFLNLVIALVTGVIVTEDSDDRCKQLGGVRIEGGYCIDKDAVIDVG